MRQNVTFFIIINNSLFHDLNKGLDYKNHLKTIGVLTCISAIVLSLEQLSIMELYV